MDDKIAKSTNDKLSGFSTAELLKEIVRREGTIEAPTRTMRHTPHVETLVGIGPDHTAHIVIDMDGFRELVNNH